MLIYYDATFGEGFEKDTYVFINSMTIKKNNKYYKVYVAGSDEFDINGSHAYGNVDTETSVEGCIVEDDSYEEVEYTDEKFEELIDGALLLSICVGPYTERENDMFNYVPEKFTVEVKFSGNSYQAGKNERFVKENYNEGD